MKKNMLFLSTIVILTIVNIPKLISENGIKSLVISTELSYANSESGGCESKEDSYEMGGCVVHAFDCYPGGPLSFCWKGQYMQCCCPPETYGWEQGVNCN